MEGTSELRIDTTRAPTRKRDKRSIAIGDTVTVERKALCGGKMEKLTFKLTSITDLSAKPMELGPERPVHKAVLGKHPGQRVQIPAEAKIVSLDKPVRKAKGH